MRFETDERPNRIAVAAIVLGTVPVLLAATAIVLILTSDSGQTPEAGAPPSATTAPATPGTSSSTVSTPSPAPSSTQRPPARVTFAYQPLWPFTDIAEVQRWQRAYRSGGHAPWHLDAGATALAFTTGYLGFADVDTVVWQEVHGTEALVAVGYAVDADHARATASVLHLARYGTGADAPWEVVGSKDTTLTLTQPRYSAVVASPMTVGGRVTGVDENIRVQVRQPSSAAPLGESPGIPAGGDSSPWSTRVSFQGARDPALTVVASTGGHVTGIERFAITAVRSGR